MTPPPLARPPADIERIVFLGTPEASVPSLRALVAAGYEVVAVITQPDRRRGRGSGLDPSPVKKAALDLGLEVRHRPDDLLDPDLDADLGVVVAYGRIIRRELLERLAMVNVHFSRLPRWRGAAPVERAILAGDTTIGVDIIQVAEGLDEGDVYASVTAGVEPDESAADLTERLAELGAELLVKTLVGGLPRPTPQVGDAVYAAKVEPEERMLDFSESAEQSARRVRLGRAWTRFRGARLIIERARVIVGTAPIGTLTTSSDGRWAIGTADGLLVPERVKPEGKRAMSVQDWANGAGPEIGEPLA
jgi:methionyl-tRNA formyltransferase